MDDKEFISTPDERPDWPILTVKRRKKDAAEPEVGIIYAGALTTIYLVNMWDLVMHSVKLQEVEKLVYKSIEELLADGWVPD